MLPRIVIISGAAAGLGLSLTQKFLQGGDVVYGVTRTKRHWPSTRKKLSRPENFFLHQVDLTQEGGVKRFLELVRKRTQRIDVLVNNAGYANLPTHVEEESLKEFQKNLSANLVSTFLMCKYALPIFQRQNAGWIVNISSMAGKRAVPSLAAYSASKFGVLALSQCIAKENLNARFKCVTFCPGGMNTQMRAKVFGKEDSERQQSTDFVAEKIIEVLEGKISVESGGDVCIRHGRITAINPPPEA